MRIPEYLSPSALQTWIKKKEDYFLKYLSTDRPPRMKQTEPMAVGSAFDAHAKCNIVEDLKIVHDGQFDFKTIFDVQVEEHNREKAAIDGKHCWDEYVRCGAYQSLLNMLRKGTNIRMEYTQRSTPVGDGGLILLGKPDLTFTTGMGLNVTIDWKVNGYYSANGVAPIGGYVESFGSNRGPGRGVSVWYEKDFPMNAEFPLEKKKKDWALQLATYGWLGGIPLGDEMYVGIDQLCWKDGALRVAQHRCEISKQFQQSAYTAYQQLWDTIKSGWIFQELSREDSDQRCTTLERTSEAYKGNSPKTEWLRRVTGR